MVFNAIVNSTNFRDVSDAITAEVLRLAGDGFLADARRIAGDIFQRRYPGSSTLTWQLLREIEDETLFDFDLMCRWPDEVATCMHRARPDGREQRTERRRIITRRWLSRCLEFRTGAFRHDQLNSHCVVRSDEHRQFHTTSAAKPVVIANVSVSLQLLGISKMCATPLSTSGGC